ncbi:PH domain-containing protein [Flavihumibacter profundi]|jgi:membrane protein YdbS with pleckstrin-like domain|uniref:PH domain-containing protein n=1 Tax=Flavihumibacter profundi TaxID=2716883 RepID=UPI001CC4C9C2|nr:PH domain-containing protein [Flavihumibacter profundi]MBZ5857314.1 PH domain-containing protein [Flavihumibacter profundi]
MASKFNRNLLPDFESVRDDEEEILWTAKPKFIPYALTGLAVGFGIIVFGGISFAMIKSATGMDNSIGSSFFIMAAIPIIFFLWSFLQKIFSYSNTSYAFTNKRVMMRTGFIGIDFKSIDYDKISDIEVTVNVVERAFNVGTIKIFSGRTQTDDGVTSKHYDRWEAIPNVYEIFKKLKQVSVDIKTDFNYPNALRPEINPGYNTKYDRK